MPRTFSDSLAQDLESVFFNTDEYATEVTLRRGPLTETGIAAIVADRRYEISDESGFVTAYQATDFDIIRSKYKIRGELLEPRGGDTLINGAGEEFAVNAIPAGQCFDTNVSDATVLRVHTKRVS